MHPHQQGVPDDADVKTIKRAYYDLAMYCHPDKSGDDGHDLCIMLNEAYAILKDPISRELYDAELAIQREDDQDEFTGSAYSKWTTKKAGFIYGGRATRILSYSQHVTPCFKP